MSASSSINVQHNTVASCFEAIVSGHRAECAYRRAGTVLVLHHTAVPDALQGQGVAAALVAHALAWARQEGLSVQPACSYVAAYMKRHPETQDLLAR